MALLVHRLDGEVGPEPARLAPPVGSLAGRRIGVLDNRKPNADVVLGRLADVLAERTGATVAERREKNAAIPCEDQVLEGLRREVAVVLTGSAD